MTVGIKADAGGTFGSLQVSGSDVMRFGAAATGGVPVGGLYKTAGTVKVRAT